VAINRHGSRQHAVRAEEPGEQLPVKKTFSTYIEQRRDAGGAAGAEHLAARFERLEHTVFSDTKAS
jgi:hypothetical protein